MKKNTRKSLALLIAGIMVVTGLAFTSDNVLKAADPDAAVTEQTSDGAEGTAESVKEEQPEVKEDTGSLSNGSETTPGESEPSVESGDSSMANAGQYSVAVGGTKQLIAIEGGKTQSWTSMNTYYVTVDSKGVVTGVRQTSVPVSVVRTYKHGNQTHYEYFFVYVTGAVVQKYTLTINYVDEDNNTLFDAYSEQYNSGANYSVPSPVKDGYTADKTTVSGTIRENTTVTVRYTKDKGKTYPCYVYGLIPGKTLSSNETPDNKWMGLGVIEISGVAEPKTVNVNVTDYSFGAEIKALFPAITLNGVTYTYAAPSSAESNIEGHYTVSLINVGTADGANSGFNGYNTYVKDGNVTYHANYSISLVTKSTVFVNFAVTEPGSTSFATLGSYAQQVDKNTAESRIRKPSDSDVPATKTFAGTTYYFDGWYKDEACTQKADFSGILTANQTYYGKYTAYPTAKVQYLPGDHGAFTAQSYDAQINSATPEFKGEKTAQPGYEFDKWTPAVASKVSGDATYTATWKAKTDTPYKVEYYYEKEGSYSETPDSVDDSRTGTTAGKATATDADKTPASDKKNYVLDADRSVLEETIAGDGSTVLKVYFKQQFTVTYKPGTQGTFEETSTPGLAYGAATPEAPNAAENHKPGYTFGGWSPAHESTVTKNATYVAQWVANEATSYRVEYYFAENGEYSYIPNDYVERSGKTGTEANVTAKDKTTAKAGYAFDSDYEGNVLSGTIAGDGTLTLKVYFKERFTVTYKPGTQGTFDESTSTKDYGAATPDAPDAANNHNPGYTFDGWSPERSETVTGNAEYVATWSANTNTKYTVEYYYESEGAYPETPDSKDETRTGTTAETVSVTDADKVAKNSSYVFDSQASGNILSAAIAGDGSTVLKVYFKQQFTVTYKPGTQGTFADDVHSGLGYGAAAPEIPDVANAHKPGYTFAGWDREIVSPVTGDAEYIAQWTANTDTKYTVNYYGYDGNGGWRLLERKVLKGETNEEVEATIKGYEGYSFYDGYADNKLTGKIAGDGTLVLNVYYRVTATVTITGHTDKQKYSGTEQSVEGYELTSTTTAKIESSSELKTAGGITYDTDNVAENSNVSKVAKGKVVGTYKMNLSENMFRNTEEGFDVTFVVASDGQLDITKRSVVLTSASATKEYDGTPLTKDEITVSGDGFVEGEGFGYLFTGSQTEVGKSDNTFKYEITEEYQNTNPDNYEVSTEFGTLEVTASTIVPEQDPEPTPERKITNQISDGKGGYTKTAIADGKTPHAKKMIDSECCILHLLIMLAALAAALGYTKDMKDKQAKIHEYEEELAKAGFKL